MFSYRYCYIYTTTTTYGREREREMRDNICFRTGGEEVGATRTYDEQPLV